MNEPVRILIVEDIKTDFDLAQREIRQAVNHCVFKHVETQDDFLTALSMFQPDLILSDYNMPRFNGMKALELRNKHAPLTPFITWTGSLSEDIAVECMRAGANNYIIKENIKRLGPAVLHALREGQLLLERKQAEADVRKYADMVEHMQIGLYVFHLENREDDHSFRLISANPAALLFSDTTAEEVVGKTLDEGFPNLREQGIPQKYAEVVRTQEAIELEVVYYDDSQKLNTAYAVKAFPLPNDHLGMAFENTTARKQAEEKLSEQEKRFRSLIENSLDNISLLAQDGSLLWENPAVNRTLGYKQDEFIGRNMFELVHPDDLEWTSTTFANLLKKPGSYERGTFRLRHHNGTWRWIEAIATNFLDEPSINALVINYRDITERKQAEEALRQNQMILAQAEKMAHLGAWELDFIGAENINDNPLRWSDEVYRIFGYEPGSVEVTNDFFFECVHPDDRQKIVDAVSRALAEKRSYEIEHRVIRQDGSERIVLEHADITFDEDGKPLRMLGAIQDITERHEAEQSMLESEERFRSLFENSPVATWEEDFSAVKTYLDELKSKDIPDLDAHLTAHKEIMSKCMELIKITNVNQAALKLYQAESKSDLLGGLNKTFPLDSLMGFKDELRTIAKDGLSFQTESKVETLQGNLRDVVINWVVVPGYEQTYAKVLVSLIDITERKQAEEKLRTAEAKYRALIEQIPSIVYTAEPEQHIGITYISPQIEKIGFLQEEWIADPYLWSRQLHPEDRERILRKIEALKGSDESFQGEYRLITRTGEVRWFYDNAFPVKDGEGRTLFRQGFMLDITERKQAEDALREAEIKYRTLVEQLPAVTYVDVVDNSIQSGEFHTKYISPQVESLLGYTPSEFYADSSLWVRLIHPEDRERFLALTAEHFSTHNFYAEEYRLLTKQGREIWVRDESIIVRSENQEQILMCQGVLFDITKQKRAEDELRDREERFQQLADNIQEVFWITDPVSQKDIYISLAYEKIWGRKLEEQMQNKNLFMESIVVEDRGMVLTTIEKQLRGHKTEMEYRIKRPDGSIRWIWDRAFPILDESQNVKLVTGIAADITERKQAEGETHRHLAELQALYENGLAVGRLLSPREIGERVIQTFTHYLSWHHVTIRLRKEGSDDLELVAFSVPHLKEGESENVEHNFNVRINKVGQGMSGWVVETGVAVRTGNVHTYLQYVNTYEGIQSGMYMPLKIGERVIGCISVESEKTNAFSSQDERLLATLANQAAVAFENARLYQATQQELFDRKRAEVMLERERNSLAQRVEERTADLKRANENLARVLRVKDEFLANMSHELRTPLNAILGLSESLAEQVAGPLNEKQLKYVHTMSESGHHLLALINDILDLAKIEAGQITLDITKVDVESVCQASLRMVKQLAQKKNQDIKLEIDRDFGLIWADERRLKQMIVNLLSNAVKFTQENGKIGLEVHGDKDENRVLIAVWDNGIGISENNLSQLFKPFIQLDAGLARETSGTGLGLALVAQMARLHGGSINVTSTPGHGSRFTIIIPWEPALRADTIERLKITGKFKAIKPNGKNRQTILLIEDTQEVVMLIKDYLELAGYNVVTAEDGIEGMTQARHSKPDLILMDLQMPRMDGIETTQKLRSEVEFKYTPIIALTALAMPNDRERCLAAGMDEYISKPVNLKTLVKIIQGFLTGEGTAKANQ